LAVVVSAATPHKTLLRKPKPSKAKPAKRPARPRNEKTDWDRILRLLPGYDPFDDCEGYYFDADWAQLCIDFFPDCLCLVKGDAAGQAYHLQDWEKAVVGNLFGWKSKATGYRRFRECLFYVARKNSKSTLGAGIAALIFMLDKEPGMEIYSAAGEAKQASLVWQSAKAMLARSPDLASKIKFYQYRMELLSDELSKYEYISADADTKHGFNTHAALIDELHVCDRELVDVLTSSMGSRKQPITIYFTTADYFRESICNEKYRYACDVREGRIKNPRFLPVIYEVPRDADWRDKSLWPLANPNLGISKNVEFMEEEYQKACDIPAYENTFRNLHLNQITEQLERVIPMDKWAACGIETPGDPPVLYDPIKWREETITRLKGKAPAAGLDLGSLSDLTALVLLFREEKGITVLPYFWIPEENARDKEKKHKVPYLTWANQGFINRTPGDQTDYSYVRRDINSYGKHFAFKKIKFDRLFQGGQTGTDLLSDGFDIEECGQGFLSMAAPMKEMLRLILSGEFLHGNNPVLTWMAANLAVETDASGNMKPSKKRSTEKIDGISAGAMALVTLMADTKKKSIYSTQPLFVLG
jgi:phage terminase large subunit-like protein